MRCYNSASDVSEQCLKCSEARIPMRIANDIASTMLFGRSKPIVEYPPDTTQETAIPQPLHEIFSTYLDDLMASRQRQ